MAVPLWASDYVGIPFLSHGRDRDKGVDCWGLVRVIYRDLFDISLPDLLGEYTGVQFRDALELGDLFRKEAVYWQEIPSGQEKEGDVIALRRGGQPMHVGVVIGGGMMIHNEIGSDSVIEFYTGIKHRKAIFGFYRYDTKQT